MRFSQFIESFGSFNYRVPDDPEEQLYDFYMLNLLRGRNSLYNKANQHGLTIMPKKPEYGGEMNHEDKVDYMLDEVAKVLIPKLKSDLLEAVLFSITAEFRHGGDRDTQEIPMSHMTDMIRRQMGAKYSRIFSDFFNHLDSSFDASFRPKIQANSQLMKNTINSTPIYNSRRLASYSSMEKSTHNEKDFVEMAKFVFGEGDWDKDYGGPSWEQACDAWLQLYNSKSEDSDIIAIDHMYDIEHNTGNILDKSNHFLKNGQFTWLSNALNKKARITSPMQIIDDISPAMTQIALPAIKLKYGQTLEDKMKADTFKTQIPGAGFDDLIKKEFDENQGIYDAGIPELKMARTLRGILAAYKVRRIDFRIIELAKSKIRVPLDSQKIKQFFQQEYQNCRNIETGNFGHVKVLMTKDLIYEIQKNLEDPYGHRSGIKDRIAGETNYDDEVIKSLVDYCEKLVEDGGNVSSILAVR